MNAVEKLTEMTRNARTEKDIIRAYAQYRKLTKEQKEEVRNSSVGNLLSMLVFSLADDE